MKKAQILTLEIGSTITKANGFAIAGGRLLHIAQGFATTTVSDGDVSIGVEGAIRDLETKSSISSDGAEVFINSSAAGGLKMTVHGLTLNMTARAAKEASLGAGAIIKKLTAGRLDMYDLDEIREIKPNLILLAGGVDHGEKEITLSNAELLFSISKELNIPVIYAGNKALQRQIQKIASDASVELWIAENVFPAVDVLNVTPLRKLIHDAFSKHIIHAPGMNKISNYTSSPILPTPGAVLLATTLFYSVAGDTMVVDVGGATTDVHSVTDGSTEFKDQIIDPEPKEKRTVEGDLGVYVNASSVIDLDPSGVWRSKINSLSALPQTEDEKKLTQWLTETATIHAVERHAGQISELFTPTGKKRIIRGKDLTAIKYIIGTGGALTKNPGGEQILRKVCKGATNILFPPKDAKIIIDKNYLLSAYGTIAKKYESEVKGGLRCLLQD